VKRTGRKKSEEETIREFPIAGRLHGWFFRLREVSAGVYRAEGTDLWGRMVSHFGMDEERLLVECIEAARRIHLQTSDDVDRPADTPC
jgi:hypothetical protein